MCLCLKLSQDFTGSLSLKLLVLTIAGLCLLMTGRWILEETFLIWRWKNGPRCLICYLISGQMTEKRGGDGGREGKCLAYLYFIQESVWPIGLIKVDILFYPIQEPQFIIGMIHILMSLEFCKGTNKGLWVGVVWYQ